jgi:hypothetical protein
MGTLAADILMDLVGMTAAAKVPILAALHPVEIANSKALALTNRQVALRSAQSNSPRFKDHSLDFGCHAQMVLCGWACRVCSVHVRKIRRGENYDRNEAVENFDLSAVPRCQLA